MAKRILFLISVVSLIFGLDSRGFAAISDTVLIKVTVRETTHPAQPTGLVAQVGDGTVVLSWNANSETDLAGYNVYRSQSSGGPYNKINSGLITQTSYKDIGLSNGTTYYYVVTAKDIIGNESGNSQEVSALPRRWIVDVHASPGAFSPNEDGQYDTTNINYRITLDSKISLKVYNANNNLVRTLKDNVSESAGYYTKIWDGKDSGGNVVADGIYTYTIEATDPVTGSTATPVSGQVTLDNTLPTGSITEPASNATLSGTVTIKGTTDDLNYEFAHLFYGQGTSPTSWNYITSRYSPVGPDPGLLANWNTTSLPNGGYVLRLEIYDQAGNVRKISLPVKLYNVTIYNVSDSPDPISPNNDGVQDTTTINAKITAESNWTINIKDAGNNIKRSISGTGSSITKIWDGKDSGGNVVADGIYTYTIEATDPVTGSTATPVSGQVTLDNTLPTGSITEPASNATLSGTVTIKGTTDDLNYEFAHLFYGQGTSPTSWNYITSRYSPVGPDPGLLANWNTTSLPNGGYVLRLEIYDQAGNVRKISLPVKLYNVTIYNVSVWPNFISPNNDGVQDTTTINAKITAESNWTINIKDAGNNIKRSISGTGSSITKIWDGKDSGGNVVADGIYTYTIEATDPVTGSTATPVSGQVTLDNTLPTGSITEPASNATLSGTVAVKGLSSDINFYSWALYYGQGTSPTSWSWITNGYSPVGPDPGLFANWATTSLTNGDYVLKLEIYDQAGNVNERKIPVYICNENGYFAAPVLFSPNSDGRKDTASIVANFGQIADWTLRIKDASQTEVRVFNGTDRAIRQVWDGKDSGGIIVPDGIYTYYLEALHPDTQEIILKGQQEVEVDNTPPIANITQPIADSEVTGNVAILGIANDAHYDANNANIFWGVGQSPLAWNIIANITSPVPIEATLANWNTASLAAGSYALRLFISDLAGNTVEHIVPLAVYNVRILSFSDSPDPFTPDSDGDKDTNTILATLSMALDWTVIIKNQSGSPVRTFTGHSDSITQPWDGKDTSGNIVADGAYTYTIQATDPNTGTAATPVSENITCDTALPVAQITAPQENAVVSGLVPIIGTASDNNFTNYKVEYGSGDSPSTWAQVVTSASSVTNNALASWNTLKLVNGIYTIRLTVTDIAGHVSYASVRVNVDNIKITNVAASPAVFNPSHNEVISINYTIDRDADVTVTIQDLSYNTIATIGPNPKLAGINTAVWNGKNSANNIVPDDAYTFTIEAANGISSGEYTPEYIPATVGLREFVLNNTFDPHNNQLCQINYNLVDYAQVLICVGVADHNLTIVNWKPRAFGSNTDYWNGRDPNGNIVDPNTATIAIWTRALPDEPIIAVSEFTASISTDPYSIIPSYGEFTTITYVISEPAEVTVSLYYPDGALVKTLEEAVNKQAGTYELTWDGTDANNKIVSQEGNFTVKVEATGLGAKAVTALGNINAY